MYQKSRKTNPIKSQQHSGQSEDLEQDQLSKPAVPFQLKSGTKTASQENIHSEKSVQGINPVLRSDSGPIQRNPERATPSINFPLGMGAATTNYDVALGLLSLSSQFSDLSREIKEREGYTGDTDSLDHADTDLVRTSRRFTSREPEGSLDPGECLILQMALNGYEDLYNNEFSGYRGHIARSIDRANGFRSIPEMTPEIAESRRVAFENGDASKLEQINELISNIADYNEKTSTWIGRVSAVSSRVRGSSRLQTLKSATEAVGDYGGKIGQIITCMRTVDTLANGGNGSSTQRTLNRFQASLDAIDVAMSFADAVPVIGELWSSYYYPAATACIKLLGKISAIRDRDNRLLTWISSNWNRPTPPSLRGVSHSFMGGQPVFSFMWHIYFNNYSFNQDAEDFFMEHQDQFNSACPPGFTISGEWNPFEDNHIRNFESWVTRHKNTIWTMLYGADLPYPNTHIRPGEGDAPE